MKKTFKLMLAATAAAALVACGGGGGSSTPMEMVATQNLSTPLTAGKIGAIAGPLVSFTYPNGVPSFRINSATTVTLNADSFKVTVPSGRAAEGSLAIATGLCTFNSSTSTFTDTPLDQDYGDHTAACSLQVDTDGVNAQGLAVNRPVRLVLDGTASANTSLSIQVMPDGKVYVRNVYVGDVTVGPRPVSGASGASGGFF